MLANQLRGSQLVIYARRILRLTKRSALDAAGYPGIPPLICFAALFACIMLSILKYLNGGWGPRFPVAWVACWTAWVTFLITLPIFATSQLLWLLGSAWYYRKSTSRRRTRDQENMASYTVVSNAVDDTGSDDARWEERYPGSWMCSPSSSSRRSWFAKCFSYTFIIIMSLSSCARYEYEGDIRHRLALQNALTDPHRRSTGYARGEKIFVAAAFHQNEAVLPYWTRTILDTIVWLGADNVFVSAVESHSTDRSPELLLEFAHELDSRGVRNRVLVRDDNPSLPRPGNFAGNDRIEFLAAVRNRVLQPLLGTGGYDKVLFSNDVFIEPESVIELLETRGGDFDFACGLDFGHFGVYDAWVLRDRLGRLTAAIWPYFFDSTGYEAVKAEEPAPVFTCWNGIVVFKADPLLPVHLRSNRTLSQSPLPEVPPPGHPWAKKIGPSPALTPPLVFRASAEGECFSSESFLLPYDFRRIMGLTGIYVNPLVINGYAWRYYVWYKWVLRQRYVKWFVERVWDGAWMQYARMVEGDPKLISTWDGGDCHPFHD